MKPPAQFYARSDTAYPALLQQLEDPLHDQACRVYDCGSISLGGIKVYVGSALAGERVGLRELEPGRCLHTFEPEAATAIRKQRSQNRNSELGSPRTQRLRVPNKATLNCEKVPTFVRTADGAAAPHPRHP
jgi:hypothetical protein